VIHLGDIEIIGHRGYAARAPENTLASIEAALTAGARALEFDVHVAFCGTPVVIHDETLDRTTDGEGPVSQQTVEQLRTLDAGAWFNPAFSGERIPTLTEALDRVAGRVHHIYPEVKGIREPSDVDRIVRLVQERAMSDRTTLISIDWSILERVRTQDAAIRIGFIVVTTDLFDEALSLAVADPAAILDLNHQIALEEPSVVRRAKDEGVDVVTWTVNEPDEATRLRHAGVTGFTTDHVERLLEWSSQQLEGQELK
jgi:glycerophosphoryl diester phosphodiesterase